METDLYAILELPPTATEREIDHAYARLRRGKGADKAGYKVLKHAHKTLANINSREIYDAELATRAHARRVQAALLSGNGNGNGNASSGAPNANSNWNLNANGKVSTTNPSANPGSNATTPKSAKRASLPAQPTQALQALRARPPSQSRAQSPPPRAMSPSLGAHIPGSTPVLFSELGHGQSGQRQDAGLGREGYTRGGGGGGGSHGHGHAHGGIGHSSGHSSASRGHSHSSAQGGSQASHGHGAGHSHGNGNGQGQRQGQGYGNTPTNAGHRSQSPRSRPYSPRGAFYDPHPQPNVQQNMLQSKQQRMPQSMQHSRSSSLPALSALATASPLNPSAQARLQPPPSPSSPVGQQSSREREREAPPDEVDPWARLDGAKRRVAMMHDRRFRAEFENHLVTPPLPTAHDSFTMTDTAGTPIGKGYTVKWAEGGALKTWTGTTRSKSSGGVLSGVVWSYI